MDTIRVYEILRDNIHIALEQWNDQVISFEAFKENRKALYGNDIVFRFKYCFRR